MWRKFLCVNLLIILICGNVEAKLPEIDSSKALEKVQDILKSHASFKELTPEIMKRTLVNYIDELDPSKTYFIKSDIEIWIEPSDGLLKQVLAGYNKGDFKVFSDIQDKMVMAIKRHRELDAKIDLKNLPKSVKPTEFKKMEWVASENELLERLKKIKALQVETAEKLEGDLKEKAMQRVQKHQQKFEEEVLNQDPKQRLEFMLSNILKATASALDVHTTYFTPDEASQFMINVQQRLFGIGAQLRDDINGFTVIKIIEGGPAFEGKQLKVKDRIIAVDKEPVVGMDITDAVDLIRGKEKTPVILTVIREEGEGDEKKACNQIFIWHIIYP